MGNRGIPLKKETVKKIIVMHEEGETLGFVAKSTTTHRDTVKSYIKKFEDFKSNFVLRSFLKSLDE